MAAVEPAPNAGSDRGLSAAGATSSNTKPRSHSAPRLGGSVKASLNPLYNQLVHRKYFGDTLAHTNIESMVPHYTEGSTAAIDNNVNDNNVAVPAATTTSNKSTYSDDSLIEQSQVAKKLRQNNTNAQQLTTEQRSNFQWPGTSSPSSAKQAKSTPLLKSSDSKIAFGANVPYTVRSRLSDGNKENLKSALNCSTYAKTIKQRGCSSHSSSGSGNTPVKKLKLKASSSPALNRHNTVSSTATTQRSSEQHAETKEDGTSASEHENGNNLHSTMFRPDASTEGESFKLQPDLNDTTNAVRPSNQSCNNSQSTYSSKYNEAFNSTINSSVGGTTAGLPTTKSDSMDLIFNPNKVHPSNARSAASTTSAGSTLESKVLDKNVAASRNASKLGWFLFL